MWKDASVEAKLKLVADPTDAFAQSEIHQQASKLQMEIDASAKGYTTTLVAKELEKPRETKILHRGEYNQPQGAPRSRMC